MKSPRPDFRPGADAITAEATRWVMRLDRGLSPAEQDSYLQWLAADPRHAEAMATFGRTWESFDRLAGLQSAVEVVPNPDLLQPRPHGWAKHRKSVAWAAATPLLAASLAVMFALRHEEPTRAREPLPATVAGFVSLAPIEERTLEDGSVLRLNRGAVVTVHYTATERRLRLKKGEASFKVAEDPARPFVVETTGVAVRAVGTEFNVQLGDRAIDIIVTEGTVALVPASGSTDASPSTVSAGQRALVPIEPAAPRATVSTPPPEELSRRLAWQPRLLTFNDEPLAVILGEFNRHNPVTLRLDDPGLQELRLSARFRSDNVQGFLRLLESEFRVRSHAQGNGEVVLRSAESLRSPKTHQ